MRRARSPVSTAKCVCWGGAGERWGGRRSESRRLLCLGFGEKETELWALLQYRRWEIFELL